SESIGARATRLSGSRTGRAASATDLDEPMTPSERRSGRPWSVPLSLADVPEAGRHLDLVADSKTRAAVAEHAGLVALPRLEASFDVPPHARGALPLFIPRSPPIHPT